MKISNTKYYIAIRIINLYEKSLREGKFVSVQESEAYNKARETEEEYLKQIKLDKL